MIANPSRFPDRLVHDRVERYSAPREVTPQRLRLKELRPCFHQCSGKSSRDLRAQSRKQLRQPAGGGAEVGPGEHDAGADDPDADLAGAEDREA